jgi:hypothetical protein
MNANKTTNLPDTLDELNAMRNGVMSDYVLACETEQEQNDDEDYTPGDSARLLAILRVIDAKIRTMPKPVPTAKPEIDLDNPMSWPPLSSPEITVEMAYGMGQKMSSYPGGVHPDQIDAHGFVGGIERAYRRGWEEAIESKKRGE